MKKKSTKLILIISLIIILIITIGIIMYFVLTKKDTRKTNNNGIKTELLTLFKQDYDFCNLIYGKPLIYDSYITDNNTKYYLLKDNKINSISKIYSLLNKTYAESYKPILQNDINKFNTFLGTKKNLYININSKCDIDSYTNDIELGKKSEDKILVKYNKKSFYVKYENKKYILEYSPYRCKTES